MLGARRAAAFRGDAPVALLKVSTAEWEERGGGRSVIRWFGNGGAGGGAGDAVPGRSEGGGGRPGEAGGGGRQGVGRQE